MKRRLRNIITVLLAITTMITSCGYFESDGISFQDSIVGNIKVQRQENSSETDLVLELSPDIFSVLTQNCDAVFYDEEKNLIFSRSTNEGVNPSYNEIKIDSIGQGIYKLSKKTALSESQFRKKTEDRAPRWTRKGERK